MQARAVESQILRPLDIRGEFLRTVGRIYAFRIISLIEHQSLKYRFPVYKKPIPFVFYVTQSEICIHFVLAEPHLYFIQFSAAYFP